jgi:hypothetical protein
MIAVRHSRESCSASGRTAVRPHTHTEGITHMTNYRHNGAGTGHRASRSFRAPICRVSERLPSLPHVGHRCAHDWDDLVMTYGIPWNREGESFPVGSFVRADEFRYGTNTFPIGKRIGRVTSVSGRMVAVRWDASSGGNYDADWLHRTVIVRARYWGPGMMPRRSEFLGARMVVSGTHGDRRQMTVPYDDAERDMYSVAVERFARERDGMCKPSAELLSDRRGVRTYAVTEYGTCECSDEYGPCEFHGETIVMREGSSSRAADDLCHEFLTDVASVLHRWPSPEFERDTLRLGNALADSGGSWFDNPDDAEEARDLVSNGEAFLGDAGYVTYWDDGYRIIRPLPGCPLYS